MSLESFLRSFEVKSVPSSAASFVEGQCMRIEAEGMYFIVKAWDDGKHLFGPAPWPVSSPAPAAGDRVLVLFLGAGVERPWVLGWWPS